MHSTISWQELAKCYLKAELLGMLPKSLKEIEGFLAKTDNEQLNRLLFGLSTIYRANSMHSIITNENLEWNLTRKSLENTYIDGFDTQEITLLLRSKEIDNNPKQLIKYLRNSKELSEKYKYLITPQEYNEDEIIFGRVLPEKNNRIQIIDGGHRAINYILNNQESIQMYCYTNNKENDHEKSIIPQSVFFWLKTMALNLKEDEFEKLKGIMNIIDQQYRDNKGRERYFFTETAFKEEKTNFKEKIKKIIE